MTEIQTGIFVFGMVFALDFVWTRYISTVAERNPLQSAFWSVGTVLLGGAAAIEYVRNPWMLVPAGIGAFAATWIAVTREKNRHATEPD